MARSGRGRPPLGFVPHRANGQCGNCYTYVNRPVVHATRPLTYRGRPKAAEVDVMVVERMLAGDRLVPCSNAELHSAILTLDGRGLSAPKIAERLGVTPRTVTRHRTAQRAAA